MNLRAVATFFLATAAVGYAQSNPSEDEVVKAGEHWNSKTTSGDMWTCTSMSSMYGGTAQIKENNDATGFGMLELRADSPAFGDICYGINDGFVGVDNNSAGMIPVTTYLSSGPDMPLRYNVCAGQCKSVELAAYQYLMINPLDETTYQVEVRSNNGLTKATSSTNSYQAPTIDGAVAIKATVPTSVHVCADDDTMFAAGMGSWTEQVQGFDVATSPI